MSETVVVDVAGMQPGDLRAVEAGGRSVLVCCADGEFFAIENQCPHIHIPLDGGRLVGCALECPLHGGKLDVRTGADLALPIRKPARTFRVTPVEGGIEIDLGEEALASTTT